MELSLEQEVATNPVAGADAPAPGVTADDAAGAVQAETIDTEQPTDVEASDGQAAEDDGEDIEHDGKTYRVPKDLKAAFLRQADYTRKTQEVAEQRRALESEQARVQQMDRWAREHTAEIGQLVAIDGRLAQFAQVNWQQWSQQDPVAAQTAFFEYQQLKDARGQTVASLQQRDAQRAQAEERDRATRLAEGRAQLAKAIPGWNDTKSAELGRFGIATYGLKAEEVDNLTDPRLVRVLHDASLWRQHEAKQRAAAKATQPATPPAQPVTVIGARKAALPVAASSPTSDRLSTAEWMKRREAELAKRR